MGKHEGGNPSKSSTIVLSNVGCSERIATQFATKSVLLMFVILISNGFDLSDRYHIWLACH